MARRSPSLAIFRRGGIARGILAAARSNRSLVSFAGSSCPPTSMKPTSGAGPGSGGASSASAIQPYLDGIDLAAPAPGSAVFRIRRLVVHREELPPRTGQAKGHCHRPARVVHPMGFTSAGKATPRRFAISPGSLRPIRRPAAELKPEKELCLIRAGQAPLSHAIRLSVIASSSHRLCFCREICVDRDPAGARVAEKLLYSQLPTVRSNSREYRNVPCTYSINEYVSGQDICGCA